ncbi:periplasmic heavy metal sensor [Ruegeria sp. SCSIO 43209]|uniref:periplasmic heavy metal sensor n=1 Tax=Ruegeria sp. SCSIO 43209 TaxID=2793010 RepID=UPI00147FF411|nr:periplasmic heavy metal sensor [Ruegeria sp. SCSIO 43209]UAB89791.1 periplasmic heavy metal sensor [Ruegeria sp. SCSIO 43209]
MSDHPAPKRKWMPILLVVSLALNLLIVGVILGAALRFKGSAHADAPPGFGPALYYALPKSDRKALRGELSDLRGKGSHRRKQDFTALSQVLRAVPFDPAAVASLLAQQSKATADLQTALHQQWLAQISAMNDDQRAAYADRLEDVVKRGPRKHKKRD